MSRFAIPALRRALFGSAAAAFFAAACSSGAGSYWISADGGADAFPSPADETKDASAKRKDARASDAPDADEPANETGCTLRASVDCYDGDLYYFDSCGDRGALKQECTNGCEGAACATCETHASSTCSGDDLYWFDSCGKREDLKQACSNGCSGTSCNTCTTHASAKCSVGDVYWYDSCGVREDLKEDCVGTCTAGVCAASTWRCSNSSTCFCLVTTDALSYPSTSCTSIGNCCFEYVSTSGPACYCGTHDATTCNAYISSYDGTSRSSCPPP